MGVAQWCVSFSLWRHFLFVSNDSIECRLIHGVHLDALFERVHGIYPFNCGYFPHCIHQFALDTCSSRLLFWIVPLLLVQHILANLSCSLISNNEYYRQKSVNHSATPTNRSALKPPRPTVLPKTIDKTGSIEQKINIHPYHPSVANPK